MLQGLHALKHALRFGAQVEEIVTADAHELDRLARDFAPDFTAELKRRVVVVPPNVFKQLGP